jgi:hypothetical protein
MLSNIVAAGKRFDFAFSSANARNLATSDASIPPWDRFENLNNEGFLVHPIDH